MPNRIIILLFLVFSSLACQHDSDLLSEGFRNPPSDTRPWVYWYWIDENISKNGITKDLEAMARVGIGQALIGHISPGKVRGETKMLTEEWWDMLAFAVKEGQRLGVDIGLFNGPGWSQSGGPWIKLDQSMRYVASSELIVRGPATFNQKLPEPGLDFNPIAVQAFPVDLGLANTIRRTDIERITSYPDTRNLNNLVDGDTATTYLFQDNSNSEKLIIEFHCKGNRTIQTLKFHQLPVSLFAEVEFQRSDSLGKFTTVRKFAIDRRNVNFQIGPKRYEPVLFSVPSTTSSEFRLVFENIKSSDGAGFKEIELQAIPVVDQYIDKQLGKMSSDPLPLWNAYLWPNQPEPEGQYVVKPEKIINLTSQVDDSGILHWEIPAGDWVIMNSGMVPSGAVNVPAPPEATGYESDKFSSEATVTHFNSFVGKFLEKIPEADRQALKTVVIDSYEVGSQNWSNDFVKIFLEKFGYDPIPWLPVFSGRIVKSADLSNRFLWDVRRLTADLIAENYVATFRKLSNKNRLNLWVENYGHWGFPAEFLQYGGKADMVSGEFWFENPFWDLGPLESRAASSAAHIYGKNKVFAEAFTAGFNFRQYPGSMKKSGDRIFCEGVNHFVLHVYIHQPWDDKLPGVTAWFGMSFQRNNTWFEKSKVWIDYLRRCHFMLQQGEAVTDVCYFIGEDAPKMTGALHPPLPNGYDYDFINAEVLEQSAVIDGSIVIPSGKKYSLLILPELETMRPGLLGKINELVLGGAKVYGPAPQRSPSMLEFPQSDQQVRDLSMKIWGNLASTNIVDKAYGKGHVFNGLDLNDVLNKISLSPDVICADTGIMWTHRKTKDLDVYFISNQHEKEVKTEISFRVKNKIPELWEPDTGQNMKASTYHSEEDRTTVPVTLDPAGSVFIVFRKDGSNTMHSNELQNAISTFSTTQIPLETSWHLYFPKDWDAPDSIHIDTLTSWTEFSHPGIKYFSGTATYKNTFTISEEYLNDNSQIILDLGDVMMMAEVIINGKNLGVLWKKPYRTEITNTIRKGKNQLEIRITNTWWNRLVGDEKFPQGFPGSNAHSPRTFTTVKAWKADDALLDAGLIGPVIITVKKE